MYDHSQEVHLILPFAAPCIRSAAHGAIYGGLTNTKLIIFIKCL